MIQMMLVVGLWIEYNYTKLIMMHSNSTLPSEFVHDTSIIRSSPTRDPYNYTLNGELSRTSMINKLPSAKNVNLGQFPQVVILFQAAEIERLSSMMTSQRLLSKGKVKQNLDRHSYQIQIKQLSSILEELRQTKAKQSKRIEQQNKVIRQWESRASNTDINTLSNKYERALLEIGKMYDDNTKLQDEVNALTIQLGKTSTKSEQDGANEDKTTIKKLKQQISTLEYANSQAAVELRQSLSRQMEEYRIRMDEKTILNKQQLEEQLANHIAKLTKLTAELDKQRAEKWELQNKQRQWEIKLKQYQAKIRNNQADIAKLVQQINALNIKLTASSHPNQPFTSLSYTYSANTNSVALPSVNSSFNANSNIHRSLELENNVALLSQQLQRLTELVKNKNNQINSLQEQLSQLRQANQKQLLKVRIKYEGDIRKQVQTAAEEKDRLAHEIQKYKSKVKQLELAQQESRHGLDTHLIKIKQEQRKICQAVFNRKVQALEMQYGRDREEVNRLRKMVSQLNEQVDTLNSRQAQLKSQRNIEALKYVSQIEEQQKRYEFRLKSLEEEMMKESEKRVNEIKDKDRQQYSRLQKQIKLQAEYLRERETDSLQRVRNINEQYDSNIAIIEREKNMKIQAYKQQLAEERKSIQELNSLIKEKNRQIGKLSSSVSEKDNLIFQLGNAIRQKQREIGRLSSMNKDYELQVENSNAAIRELEREKQLSSKIIREREMQIEHNNEMLRERERQIRHFKDMIENANSSSLQQARQQYELLHKKLDYLSQETTSARATIVQTISANPKSQNSELLHINSTLEFLCNQITSISRQIYESSLNSYQKQTKVPANFYSPEYVKQLQAQCDNYLAIINGNLANNDSVLKRIWEQIQSNNRYNRQQHDKWRQAFAKQEGALEKLYDEKYKWEQTRYESEQMNHHNKNLQQRLQQAEQKYRQLQSEKQELILTHKNMVSKYSEAIQEMEKELKHRDQLVNSYSSKLQQENNHQSAQIAKMTQIIQSKTKEIGDLSRVVGEYQKRYDGLRDQFKGMEEVVGRVLQDRQTDFSSIDRLEIENAQLKRQMKKINQELVMERNEKSKIIDRSREHLAKLTQQLLLQTPSISYPIPPYQNFSQTTKLLSLQSDFSRLEQTIHRLKKQNYLLTKQNYNESTQDYVNKEFAHTKIVELNKESERLMQQNIELKDEIERCRLQFAGQVNGQIRYEQNLGVMVLLFAQIQALRNRLQANGRLF